MTDAPKKDPIGELLDEAELDRIALEVHEASPEQLRAELAREGYGPEKMAELFAEHAKVMRAGEGKPARRVVWLGEGFAGGLAVAAVLAGIYVSRHPGGTVAVPTATTATTAAAGEGAAKLRERAFEACATKRYAECLALFDEAKRADETGDGDPDVQRARAIARGEE